MTFRAKTIAGIALLQIAVLAVLLFITVGAMRASGREEVNRRADVTVGLIAASAKDALISKDFATLDALVAETMATGNVAVLRFLDETGTVLAQSQATNAASGLIERRQTIAVAGTEFGAVQLGVETSAVEAAVLAAGRVSVVIAILGIALTALFSWVLGTYLTNQLNALRRAGGRLAAGALDTRVPITGTDELADTARSFNVMAEKMQEVVRTLAENEASLRLFSEASSDWYWESDQDHRISWLSPRFAEAAVSDPSDILGKARWDLAKGQDQELWAGHMADLAAHRKFRDFRYWFGKNKALQWVSISGAPRYDDSGNFVGYCGSGSNITAQADVAMQLRLFSRIVDQSPVSVVVTDPGGAIQYVNPCFSQVTGYGVAEITGLNPRVLASGQTPAHVYHELWSSLSDRRPWQGEFRNKKKTGEDYWEQANIFPILDDHGDIAHFVAIKEDITARKESEIVLAERTRLVQYHYESLRALSDIAALPVIAAHEQLTRALALGAKHLGFPVGIIGRIDGDTYTVLHHQAGAEAPLHDGQTFAVGQTYCALTMKANDVVAIAHMGQSAFAGHPCYQALGLEAYIGTPYTVRGQPCGTVNFSSAAPFARDFNDGDMEFMRLLGRWVGAVMERDLSRQEILTAKDVAEAAQRSLAVQAKKLAETNGELEQFAYVASHDLRQPLRMIASYLSLIERRLGKDLSEDLQTYLGFAVDGAKRMDRLILDLLQYSRTGRGGETALVPLGDAIAEALANLAVAIQDAKADIIVAAGLPVLQGDAGELVRLFQNLIGNAIKYVAPDRHARVEIGWVQAGGEYRLWVKDNGIGIAPEDRDRAFMVFQRLVAQESYEGTGIGLAICKKIVEHHGGRIWIESEAGLGSTFFMTFPVAQA